MKTLIGAPLLLLVCLCGFNATAQVTNTGFIDTSGAQHLGKLSLSAYLDLYYSHFTGSTGGTGQLPYLVSSARNNEVSLNLAHIDIRYNDENLRARFVPGFGSYMNSNHGAEPGTLAYVVEASAGVRISKKRNIWLDGGVIGSPYSNENPVSKDHLMYTRSLAAENVPYYLSGLKLTIPVSRKLKAVLYGLNGWQQVRDLNNQKSLGTQLEWTVNENNLLNWDTYLGDERQAGRPNERMRWFTDLYWIGKAGKHWDFTSCVFYGIQQRRDTVQAVIFTYQPWWNANFIARYRFNSHNEASARVEWFSDPGSVIQIPLNPAVNGYETGSAGICLGRRISEKALFRLEWRRFLAKNAIYRQPGGDFTRMADWFTGSMAVWF